MKKNLVNLVKEIGGAFSAFAHEHHGEMLSFANKNQLLTNLQPVNNYKPVLEACVEEGYKKRILLAFENEIDVKLLKYTIDSAANFNAGIDVFISQNDEAVKKRLKKAFNRQSISWRLLSLDTENPDKITGRDDVLFVVTDKPGAFTGKSLKKQYAA